MATKEPTLPPRGEINKESSTPLTWWDGLRERLLTLKPCRFAVIMVLAGLVFLIWAPQGADVVRALAER